MAHNIVVYFNSGYRAEPTKGCMIKFWNIAGFQNIEAISKKIFLLICKTSILICLYHYHAVCNFLVADLLNHWKIAGKFRAIVAFSFFLVGSCALLLWFLKLYYWTVWDPGTTIFYSGSTPVFENSTTRTRLKLFPIDHNNCTSY